MNMITRMLRRCVLPALVCAAVAVPFQNAEAVPAYPGLIAMTQPDGSVMYVRLVGDERSHHFETEDGYVIVPTEYGFRYALGVADGVLLPSDVKATPLSERSATEKSFLRTVDRVAIDKHFATVASMSRFNAASAANTRGLGLGDSRFPSKGEQCALVILAEFSDRSFTMDDPQGFYTDMLNKPGFDTYDATGSARDFFLENSMNQFLPQFDVYGPVRLSKNVRYYGQNDMMGAEPYAHEMIIECCQALDDTLDFSLYDRDNNGVIDNIFVIYAGYGEADSGMSNTIWPHAYNLTDACKGEVFIFDDVRANQYGCTCEMDASYQRPDGIGTFVHEFSHVLGLPDLYSTTYNNARTLTPGTWSTLDSGPYNNRGRTPPAYGAYERVALDWLAPTHLKESGIYTLPSIMENEAFILRTHLPNEYFLLENRQQQGWDKYVEGHGMLIWHIDYNESIWDSNAVNNTATHQHVDIIEADGLANKTTKSGDPFPGKNNVTSIDFETFPMISTWGGLDIGVGLYDIAENDGVITFLAKIDPEGLNAMANAVGDIVSDSGLFDVVCDGLTLTMRGDESAAVYDTTGRLVTVLRADQPVELPSEGLYIVRGSKESVKILAR